MTQTQELRYLTDLLLASTQWVRPDENSPTGLELEIKDRIQQITESLGNDDEEDEPKPDKYERQRKYTEGKIRVSWTDDDGKTHRTWYDKDLCKQIPIAAGCCTKMKWVLKDQEELNKPKEIAEEN